MAVVRVVTPWHDNWYTDAVVDGLRGVLAAAGHTVAVDVVPYGGSTRVLVTDLLDRTLGDPAVLGAVGVGFRLREEEARRLLAHGKPVVVTGGTSPYLPSVRVDDVAAARTATEHLIALGHRSITHVSGFTVMANDFAVWSDRIRGYTEAMRAAGLESSARVLPSEAHFESVRRVARELLADDERPTAVFAAIDELAFGVRAAAQDLGLEIPRDLSLVSIDDHPDAARFGITTVRQVPAETGAAAAARLLGRTDDDLQLMDMTLVERRSTAAPAERRPRGPLTRLFRRG